MVPRDRFGGVEILVSDRDLPHGARRRRDVSAASPFIRQRHRAGVEHFALPARQEPARLLEQLKRRAREGYQDIRFFHIYQYFGAIRLRQELLRYSFRPLSLGAIGQRGGGRRKVLSEKFYLRSPVCPA